MNEEGARHRVDPNEHDREYDSAASASGQGSEYHRLDEIRHAEQVPGDCRRFLSSPVSHALKFGKITQNEIKSGENFFRISEHANSDRYLSAKNCLALSGGRCDVAVTRPYGRF